MPKTTGRAYSETKKPKPRLMATRNQQETPAPEYQLSAGGQLALRTGERDWPPVRRPRPIAIREIPCSQSEIDRDRELRGHQLPLPTFKNVIVEAIQEHTDRTFFEQTLPSHVEMAPATETVATEPTEAEVELAEPTEADTVIEFPPPTLRPAA